MTKGGKRHWARSAVFLTAWVAFGGIVLAGWLTQLRPSANFFDGGGFNFDTDSTNSSDSQNYRVYCPDTQTTVVAGTPCPELNPSGPAATEYPGESQPTTGSQTGAQGGGDGGADAAPSAEETSFPEVDFANSSDITVPASALTDEQKQTFAAQKNSDGTYTLNPTQAKAAGVAATSKKGAAQLKVTKVTLNKDDKVAHPFGIQLGAYIGNLYQWALVIGAGLAVMMIMWAGYTYVISAGDPEVVRQAKDYLWGALLGLLLLIITYATFNTLKIGVPGSITAAQEQAAAAQAAKDAAAATPAAQPKVLPFQDNSTPPSLEKP